MEESGPANCREALLLRLVSGICLLSMKWEHRTRDMPEQQDKVWDNILLFINSVKTHDVQAISAPVVVGLSSKTRFSRHIVACFMSQCYVLLCNRRRVAIPTLPTQLWKQKAMLQSREHSKRPGDGNIDIDNLPQWLWRQQWLSWW